MLLATAALMSACSSDDDVTSYYPEDNVVRVATNVNNMATRASFTNDNIDNIGLGIKNAASDSYSYDNAKFVKSGSTWSPDGRLLLWHNATDAVDIVAYAPYQADFTDANLCDAQDFPVTVETTQSATSTASDFLVYKKKGFVPQTDLNTAGAIPVNFTHALSRLDIIVTLGTEFDAQAEGGKLTSSPLTDFEVSGTSVTGYCDFTLDVPLVTATAGDARDVQPYESATFTQAEGTVGQETSNAKATYSCILIPQTVGSGLFTVSFKINGTLYAWTSPDAVTLEPGKYHTLNLTVGKDTVVPTAFSVKKWDTTPSTALNTD